VFIAAASACGGMKPGGASAGNKLYETFFVGEEGSQYFIKPLEFKNEKKEKVVMDFTLRYKDDIKDSALVNFTIISEDNIKSVDQILLENGVVSSKNQKINLLFVKRESVWVVGRMRLVIGRAAVSAIGGLPFWELSRRLARIDWMSSGSCASLLRDSSAPSGS
jgi:hypothetical protein